MSNLMLPGNPRYQPKDLLEVWGYDNLGQAWADVEIATMDTLVEYGKIPDGLLSEGMRGKLRAIPMSEVDRVEREVTGHDVRAWVRLAQEVLPVELRPWIHIPNTSYDVIDTARILQFTRAHHAVVWPKLCEVGRILAEMTEANANVPQVGRTHGQHALPITVGFWLATILGRLMLNAQRLNESVHQLVGKISGAVGAYNAQYAMGLHLYQGKTFEDHVLAKLGLKSGEISTQILLPEPLAYYLFGTLLTSGVFAQFGRDCRHLMRSEIREVSEAFEKGQVGSSTMAHKRNPINFESLVGMFKRSRKEFGGVLDTLLSDHQRDLEGSSVVRDFPTIVINLVQQLNTLLRKKKGQQLTFLERIRFDREQCEKNLRQSAQLMVGEIFYIFLQSNGYQGDAHDLVNHAFVPESTETGESLYTCALRYPDPHLQEVLQRFNDDEVELLLHPETYNGLSWKIPTEIASRARALF